MTNSALVSIVLVNYNTRGLLGKCLTAIFETKGDTGIEVFVADNSSVDGSVDMVKSEFPGVSVTRFAQNVGYTRAVNALLPLGKGEYYLLLHPDVELQPNTLTEFIKFFEAQPQAGVLGGNLHYPDGTPNPCEILFPGFKNDLLCLAFRVFRRVPGGGAVLGDYNPVEWSHKHTARVNWVWNACMMIRREVFERIGYFDEDFYVWYADWDLCKRASDVGWTIHYLYSARALHHERQSFAKQDSVGDEVRYKVDGWYSASRQISDRYTFLKKHCGTWSVLGVKGLNLLENLVRLSLIAGNILFQRGGLNQVLFHMRECVKTLRAILK